MIAVITGDIVASRKLINQDKWLSPLKNLFALWGEREKDWEVSRGDFFQLEIANPEEALHKAFLIKALIKKTKPIDKHKKISIVDTRMAIGIGEKTYSGDTINENNGSAYINAGEKFDLLKKEDLSIGIKTPWKEFDEEINLYFKLAGTFMDKYSISSAEIVEIVLQRPNATQEEIGKLLGIKQNSVSGRWNRAHIDELLEIEKIFRKKIKYLLQ